MTSSHILTVIREEEEWIGPTCGKDAQGGNWAEKADFTSSQPGLTNRSQGLHCLWEDSGLLNCRVCSFCLSNKARGRALIQLGLEFPNLENEEAD